MLNVLRDLIKEILEDEQMRKELILWIVVLIFGTVMGIIGGIVLVNWMGPEIPDGTLYCRINAVCVQI